MPALGARAMADGLPPGDHRFALEVAGFRREYLVHIPSGLEKPRPLVMLLHGTGGTVKWAQHEARFDSFSDRSDFVAVYPQALPPDPELPPRFIQNPPAWEVTSQAPTGKPFVDDLAFIRAMLDDLSSRTAIDPEHIYATGFSNGASMCFRLAAELSDRIAAIAPVAGYCRVTSAARPVPTLFIIGDLDPMVPPAGGKIKMPWREGLVERPPISESLDRWARAMQCTPPPIIESDINGIRREHFPGPLEFSVITIGGLGHHWPGGRGQLKRSLAGVWSNRLDANEVIWGFLSRHKRGRKAL